jgi:hypothetical protein
MVFGQRIHIMPVTAEKSAPYAPSSAVIDIINRYRSRGLPTPVTNDVLGRIGITDSLQPRTLQALHVLDLIDEDGKPTDTFEGIRLAPEAEYKKRLEDWLKAAYADVFAVYDPMTDDEVRVRDAFRSYNPVGQQNRMITLFHGLCSLAGLLPEKQNASASLRGVGAVGAAAKAQPAYRPTVKTVPKPAGGGWGGSSKIPPPLAGVLETLPAAGEGWSEDQRDKFLKAFEAMLDFSIPIQAAPEKEKE